MAVLVVASNASFEYRITSQFEIECRAYQVLIREDRVRIRFLRIRLVFIECPDGAVRSD